MKGNKSEVEQDPTEDYQAQGEESEHQEESQEEEQPDSQSWLTARMIALGYHHLIKQGICEAFSLMGTQAYLMGKGQKFTSRLENIKKIPMSIFIELGEKIKRQAPFKEWLKEEGPLKTWVREQEGLIQAWAMQEMGVSKEEFKLEEDAQAYILDILGFFDGIIVDQRIDPELLQEELSGLTQEEEIHETLAKVLKPVPEKLDEEREDITFSTLFSGIYNNDELNTYFRTWPQGTDAVLRLSGAHHSIAVIPQEGGRWLLLNANNENSPLSFSDTNDLAAGIREALFSKSNVVTFSTELCQVGENQATSMVINKWKEDLEPMHAVTDEKARQTDSNGLNWLDRAIANNDTTLQDALMTHGADVTSPLHYAVWANDIEQVKKLLDLGADPNHQVSVEEEELDGKTPLYIAAQYGHTEIIEELIKKGAQINKPNKDGYTPLYAAAYYGHDAAIKALMACDWSQEGGRELIQAVKNNDIEVVKKLLEHGANINIVDKDVNPLYLALKEDNQELINLLFENEQINVLIPICLAAKEGEFFENTEIDLNQPGLNGWSPLQWAAAYGHVDVVRELILQGAKFDYTPPNTDSPLCIAVKYNKSDVLSELLKNDMEPADINKALDLAVRQGHVESVNRLIDSNKGANLDRTGDIHSSLFYMASMEKPNLNILKKLLEHYTPEGKKPFEIALHNLYKYNSITVANIRQVWSNQQNPIRESLQIIAASPTSEPKIKELSPLLQHIAELEEKSRNLNARKEREAAQHAQMLAQSITRKIGSYINNAIDLSQLKQECSEEINAHSKILGTHRSFSFLPQKLRGQTDSLKKIQELKDRLNGLKETAEQVQSPSKGPGPTNR